MKINIRADNSAEITGYVNVVERESRVLGDFVEIIEAKTFQRALEKTDCVGLMFNHVRNLGTTNDCLELHEDNIGLFARALVTDKEVIEEAKKGKLTGWSFGFYIDDQEISTRADGIELHRVKDIDLVEVSILNCTPAYYATCIEMRDTDGKQKMTRMFDGDPIDTVDNSVDVNKGVENLEQLKRKFYFNLL